MSVLVIIPYWKWHLANCYWLLLAMVFCRTVKFIWYCYNWNWLKFNDWVFFWLDGLGVLCRPPQACSILQHEWLFICNCFCCAFWTRFIPSVFILEIWHLIFRWFSGFHGHVRFSTWFLRSLRVSILKMLLRVFVVVLVVEMLRIMLTVTVIWKLLQIPLVSIYAVL